MILDDIQNNKQDAIIWQAKQWFAAAGDDAFQQGNCKNKLAKLLALIDNEAIRTSYIGKLPKEFPTGLLSKRDLDKAVKESREKHFDELEEPAEDSFKGLPKFMDRDQIEDMGFCAVQGDDKIHGYHTWGRDGNFRVMNFVIYPLWHVYMKEESRHVFEIENHRKRVVMDIPSRALQSADMLTSFVAGEGNFVIWGNNNQVKTIASRLLDHFPLCYELKQLGWQQEGFFAYVNKLCLPGGQLVELSPWGIGEVEGKNFLIPAASTVYKDMRQADDPFENERSLTYIQSPVTFQYWATKMGVVYKEHGLTGVAFALLTIFRDIVFAVDHNCPHLYAYGEKSSGKSQYAASVTSIFYKERTAFQLNSGTDFAFFSYMQRFRNCPAHLNEFDDKSTRDEWFQAIKGVFDGEGRERGRMNAGQGSRNRTEVQKVDGTLILTGQFLLTKDDNSVVTRSIICPFYEKPYTEEERKHYMELKDMEKQGLTSLVAEVLKHRDHVKKNYYTRFSEQLSEWRRSTAEYFNQRIFQNWCHLATMWYLLYDQLQLPKTATPDKFSAYCMEQALQSSKFIRDSDILSEFWNTVAAMYDQGILIDGWHFKVEVHPNLMLRNGDGKDYLKEFGSPKKLLIIRLKEVHNLYQEHYRKRSGEKGITFENLTQYYKNRNYFVGQVKQHKFKKYEYQSSEKSGGTVLAPTTTVHKDLRPIEKNTSAHVFDYDLLGCELERADLANEGSQELPFGS